MLTEGNWHHFNRSVPANLKLIEGLWYGDKENKKLLTMLIKGYAAYGFATFETKGLAAIVEEEKSFDVEQAILMYEKAIYYGFEYLKLAGISQSTFMHKSFATQLSDRFLATFAEDDLVPLFYFAQALGSSINLQRQNVNRMGYISHVKAMMNWVCKLNPKLERGSCQLFKAIILASTPTLLGGSPKKGKKAFMDLIKHQRYNLLARLSYIQYSIIPMLDEDAFKQQMKILRKDLKLWRSYLYGTDNMSTKNFKENRHFNLYNSIANEKYKVLKNLEKELF
ncbi:MAG: hypothetical protein HON90_05420 [Halobacteriovoraceae bacterium]|nr:hypothetical protein [Halobacteriovoraceae bacterium]